MSTIEDLGRRPFEEEISWIAPAGASEVRGCHFRVRRSISRNEITSSKLYIAAESYYALYVNGVLVGTGPARGVELCNFADEYDLSELIEGQEQINIAAEVFCDNFPTFKAAPAQPAVFIRIGNLVTDGSWQLQIAPDWNGEVPLYCFQIGLTEFRDYRETPLGWQSFLDDSIWQLPEVLSSDKRLFHRDVTSCRTTMVPVGAVVYSARVPASGDVVPDKVANLLSSESHRDANYDFSPLLRGESITISPNNEGEGFIFVADLKLAYTGGYALDVEAPSGTIVDIGNNELFEGKRLNFNHLEQHGYHMVDRYIHAGGRHTIENQLHARGGRFLQIAIRDFTEPVTIHSLNAIDRRYPIDEFASFSCDDERYNQLWSRCQATMSACATDTLVDCPWREMAFWVNDMLVQTSYWLQLVGQPDLLRRSFSLALSQTADDGLIPGVCPTDGNPAHVLFPTGLYLPIILREYLRYTGDSEYVEAVLPTVSKVMEAYKPFAGEDGLLAPPEEYWNFIDWSYNSAFPNNERYALNGRNTGIVNWFHVLALDALAELQEEPTHSKQAEKLANAIQQTFWDEQGKRFLEWLPKTENVAAVRVNYALAVLSGRLSPEIESEVEYQLLDGESMFPDLYMLHFVIQALAKKGAHSKALELIDRYWCSMLAVDTPTIWESNVHEHGQAALWGVGSLCHAFALAPVTFFQQHVLGIRPLEDGFAIFTFAPICLNLNEAQGKVPTPHGWIESRWVRLDNVLNASLVIPPQTRAVLVDGREFGAGHYELEISL